MASGSGPSDVLARVVAALDEAEVPYMLSGSFASSLFGSPRATQDIDIVIHPTLGSLERLLVHFPSDLYYVNREAAREAYASWSRSERFARWPKIYQFANTDTPPSPLVDLSAGGHRIRR